MGHRKEDMEKLDQTFSGKKIEKALTILNMTFPNKTSGNRAQMFSAHVEQMNMLNNPEHPRVYTGYENRFGEYADNHKFAEESYEIVGVVEKNYGARNRFAYVYILKNLITNEYSVYENIHYEKLSEVHGYIKPYVQADFLKKGSIIPKGTLISTTNNFDEYGNYNYGINAKVAYMSLPETEEDGQVYSESFVKRNTFCMINKISITLNIGDCLLNMYGDYENYKSFPDVGEEVKDGILLVKRRVNNFNISSELTSDSCMRPMINDQWYYGEGELIDVIIHVNNQEELMKNKHREQLLKYYTIQYNYYKEVLKIIEPIIKDRKNKCSFKMKHLYEQASDYVENFSLNSEKKTKIKFSSNTGVFEFAHITFVLAKTASLSYGYKMTDRFGGKGVCCAIWPDDRMPVDEYGNRADVILSPPGIVARLNIGQNFEHEINYISEILRKRMLFMKRDEAFELLSSYISDIDLVQGKQLKEYYYNLSEENKDKFIEETKTKGIFVQQPPFHNISFEQLEYIYNKYNIKVSNVRIKRTFPNSRTTHKMPIKVEKLEDEELQFIMAVPHRLDPNNIPNPHYPKEKISDGYMFDDFIYIPDGEGGYDVIDRTTKDIYKNIISNADLYRRIYDRNVGVSVDERGQLVREYITKRPVIISDKYMILLKHNPESKMIVRSLGSVNHLGLPQRTVRSSNIGPYSTTPIKFGEMELNNMLIRVHPALAHRFISTMATNIDLRTRLVSMLLEEDPFEAHDLDIKSEDIVDDIPGVVLDALLFSVGLGLE